MRAFKASVFKYIPIIALLFAIFHNATVYATEFKCYSDIPQHRYSPLEQSYVDKLYAQTLQYLDGYRAALEEVSGTCKDSQGLLVYSNTSDTHPQSSYGCANDFKDIRENLHHIKQILAYPDSAKKCFDVQQDSKKWGLYTPNK